MITSTSSPATSPTAAAPAAAGRRRRCAAAVIAVALIAATAACGDSSSGNSGSTIATTPPTGAKAWMPGMPTESEQASAAPSVPATAGAQAPPTTTVPPARIAPAGPPVAAVDVRAVDRSNPEAVGRAVVTAWFTYNTALDTGPGAGPARAAGLLTPKLRATTTPVLPGQGAQWSTWASRNVLTVPQVAPGDSEGHKPTAMLAAFKYDTTILPVTADGKPAGAPIPKIVAVTVTNSANGWEVDDVTEL